MIYLSQWITSSDGYEARLLTYLQSGGDQIRISSPFLNGQATVRNPKMW